MMESNFLTGWTVPATLILLILLLLYLYGMWTYSTWTMRHIPGPKPVPFLGNMPDIWKNGFYYTFRDWAKKYGKIYGVYFMRDPVLFTTDLDIAKEVFLKDFTNFTNRAHFPKRPLAFPMAGSLFATEGDTWRRQRHTLTPTFSTGKLKLMAPYINRCCGNLSRAFLRHSEKEELIDIKRIFSAYVMDVIAGTGFGLETDFLMDGSHILMQAASDVMKRWNEHNFFRGLATIFPCLRGIIKFFRLAGVVTPEIALLRRLIEDLIQDRKRNESNEREDILKLMLDSQASEADIAAKPQDRQLTRTEIIAHSIIFFSAGFDTTAFAMQYMAYLLAVNPEKQEKLYQEIIKNIGDAPLTYENVMHLKYLDNVLKETLRYFPPAPLVARTAIETRTIKGVTIEAGSSIAVPLYAVMHDEEIFAEPDKFIPERFDNDDIPAVTRELAFGVGPRQCIGMRLAVYEAKMAIVTLVRQFKLVKEPVTLESITLARVIMSSPDKAILIGAKLRK